MDREQLAKLGNLVTPKKAIDAIKEDPDDNGILECAVEAGSEFIVTSDKDLLRLGEYGSIRIVTATGTTCILLTTPEDWKKAETKLESCEN